MVKSLTKLEDTTAEIFKSKSINGFEILDFQTLIHVYDAIFNCIRITTQLNPPSKVAKSLAEPGTKLSSLCDAIPQEPGKGGLI